MEYFINNAEGLTPDLEMDVDGYPTEATLDAIHHWPYNHITRLFDEIARIWHWGYGLGELETYESEFIRADKDSKYLRLATGGWGGNEALISALRRNVIAQTRWCASGRGGLHIYEYPKE